MAAGFTASFVLPIVLAVLCLCQLSGAMVKVCPRSCNCSGQDGSKVKMDCLLTNKTAWEKMCTEINQLFSENILVLTLKSQNSGDVFFSTLGCLQDLDSLIFTHYIIETIDSLTFQGMTISSELDLSFNNITYISDKSFMSLNETVFLNLSNNLIRSINDETFTGLISLKTLDLSHNRIETLNLESFSHLRSLESLNLAFNELVAFSVWHLSNPSNLDNLILRGNKLRSIDIVSSDASLTLSTLDISDNPLDCSCTLDYLIKSVKYGFQSLSNAEQTICKSPEHLANFSVTSLNETNLSCSKPRNIISYPSHEKTVLFKENLNLECRSDGYPTPSIIWITPWGERFSHSPASLFRQREGLNDSFLTYKQYEETTISVNEKNDLIISHFRGSLSGNFTCVAFNAAGNKSESIKLIITSKIKQVYLRSFFIGGYAASGMLIIGFIVGFIKMNIVRLGHKICFRVPIFSTAVSIKPDPTAAPTSQCGSPYMDDCNFSEFSDNSSVNCIEHDFTSKDPNYSPLGSPSDRRSLHIIETLEEAKDRLRYGVGRKVESMKRNVQSIKNSSSVYVHTIMESGSSAANRMKASMASGVETVKSHVQSFKELCGTGDMGLHTISMISVETDIDTNQQTSVIKQITYV